MHTTMVDASACVPIWPPRHESACIPGERSGKSEEPGAVPGCCAAAGTDQPATTRRVSHNGHFARKLQLTADLTFSLSHVQTVLYFVDHSRRAK